MMENQTVPTVMAIVWQTTALSPPNNFGTQLLETLPQMREKNKQFSQNQTQELSTIEGGNTMSTLRKVLFQRSPEKGWAITSRGRRVTFTDYVALISGNGRNLPIATISGFLARGGGTGWSVTLLDSNGKNAVDNGYHTLHEAKVAVRKYAENLESRPAANRYKKHI
jgi:hypothetical protein